MKSLILVGQIPYIGKSCLHWLEAEGLVNRRRRPNCPAGIVLVNLIFDYSVIRFLSARAPILCEKGTVEYKSIADGLIYFWITIRVVKGKL